MSARITLASTNARIDALEARIDDGFAAILARLDADAPAKVTHEPKHRKADPAPTQAQDEAPATKPLSRSAWKAARLTKDGKVRAAFRGLTREQALEAGLLPGFHMPTGEMKAAIKAAKQA